MRYLAVRALALAGMAASGAQAQDITIKPLIDARLRYENVDQAGIADQADALTLRLRSGAQATTGGFSALVEGEGTLALANHYNDGFNGRPLPLVIKLATAATVIALGFAVGSAQASVIENWESPVLPAGTSSASLPASWSVFSNNGSIDVVNSTTLLTAPAGGHQYLDLSGANTGVDLVTGINVSANTTYTLSAAIGDPSNTGDRSWSIQLWAGSV